MIARYGSAFMTPLLAFARTVRTGLTGGAPSCPARRADALLSFLTFTQIGNRPLSCWNSRLVALLVLRRRQTDKLQVLSWNPEPARASDPRTLADHFHGTWHVICVQEGAGFVTNRSLAENFHVITQHHCAAVLNKDTFAPDFTCTPIQIPCSLRYSSWAAQSMCVLACSAGRPTRRAPTIPGANNSVHLNVLER